jgi:hypothetical protein
MSGFLHHGRHLRAEVSMATQAAREQVPQAPHGLTVDALCGSITGEALLAGEAEHDYSALCQPG